MRLPQEEVFKNLLNQLLTTLNIIPKDLSIYEQAMTHKSYQGEKGKEELVTAKSHNEILEFLGDAVLDLLLADMLIEAFSNENEGVLSKKRAALVNEATLAEMALQLKLGDVLRMGRGELASAGREKPRLLASAYEALVGAIYKDQGLEFVHGIVKSSFRNKIHSMESGQTQDTDYKSKLQEMVQAVLKVAPVYELVSTEGPAHERTFTVGVKMNERLLATGIGKSKKQAEQVAAQKAMDVLINETGVLTWNHTIKTNRVKIIDISKTKKN